MNIEKLTKLVNEKLKQKGDLKELGVIVFLKEDETKQILSEFEISENKELERLKTENESLRLKVEIHRELLITTSDSLKEASKSL